MKMIGMTKSGNVLMEMDSSDVCNLQLVCNCIQQFVTEIAPGQDAMVITEALRGGESRQKVEGARVVKPTKAKTRAVVHAVSTAKGVAPLSTRNCITCKKPFDPKRKDQTCCSTECRRKIPTRSYPGTKPEVKKPVKPVPPPAPAETTKVTRLELIKRMARKGVINSPGFAERSPVGQNLDDIAEFRQAQRESGEG